MSSNKLAVITYLFISCVTFTFFWNMLVLESKLILSTLMALLVLTVSVFMTSSHNLSIKMSIKHHSLDKLYIALYLISISILIVTPRQSMLVADWSNIPLWSWLRLIPSILICNFLPGHTILGILKVSDKISFAGKTSLSHILTLFLMSMLASIIMLIGFDFESFNLIFLSTNIMLLFMAIFKRNTIQNDSEEITFNFGLIITLALIISILTYNYFLVNLSYTGFIKNDALFSFGGSLRLLKSNPEEALKSSSYPSWDRLYLAANLQISGFPMLNFATILSFIPILILPAFLFFSKILFKQNNKAIIGSTLVFTVFSGFEWIYLLFMKIVDRPEAFDSSRFLGAMSKISDQTLIVSNMVNYSWELRASTLSLIVFVVIVALVFDDDIGLRERCWLLSLCWATGYLLHIQEAFIFIITYMPWILLLVRNERRSSNALALSIISGEILSVLVSFEYRSGIYGGIPIIAALAFSLLSLIASNIRIIKDVFGRLVSVLSDRSRVIRFVVVPAVFYLYILAIVVYVSTSSQIRESAIYSVGLFPWSIFPVRFGLLLLVPLIGFLFFRLGNDGKLLTLVPVIVTHFTLTGLFDLLNSRGFFMIPSNYTVSTTGLPAYRVANLLVVPLAILCGHFIATLSERMKGRSKGLMAFFICGIVLLGSTSTVVSAEWWAIHGGWWTSFKMGPPVSPQELEAIEWLRRSTIAEDSVAAFSPRSSISVLVSGARQTLSYDAFDRLAMTDIFLSSGDPVFTMQFLSSRGVDYIYLSSEDMDMIRSNAKYRSGFFSAFLLHLLPVVFNNSQIKIYSVPKWALPNSDSKTTLLVPENHDAPSSLILYSIAEAGMDFRTVWRGDGLQFDSSVMILPQDPVMEFISTGSREGWQLQRTGDRLEVGYRELSDQTLDWSINLTNKGYHSLSYAMRTPTDFGEKVFSIQMYGDESDAFFKMLLQDTNGVVSVLKEGNIWWKGWKEFTVNIDPTIRENIDFKRITGLNIIYLVKEGREGITELRFSDIVLSGEKKSLEIVCDGNRECEQLEWVRRGGKLIVFGSSERGYFANELSIKSSGKREVFGIQVANSLFHSHETMVQDLESYDKDVTTQGVYVSSNASMPLLFRKPIGLGELVFVNVQPILNILEESEGDGQITKLLILIIQFLELGPSTKNIYRISHIIFADEVLFKGKLNAISRLFVPIGGNLMLDELRISDTNAINIYRDVTLQTVRIRGPSSSTISATEATTSRTSFTGHIVLVFPIGFEWSLRMGNGTTGYLAFQSGNETITISLKGTSVDLRTSRRLRGALENPKIDVDGRVEIAKAYFEPPENIIGGVQLLAGEYGRPITLLGRLSYTASIAVSEITVVDYLTFRGTVDPSRYGSSFGDMNAGWWGVLLSPVGIGGFAFFIATALLMSRVRTAPRFRRMWKKGLE